jgi:hypothetical protein
MNRLLALVGVLMIGCGGQIGEGDVEELNASTDTAALAREAGAKVNTAGVRGSEVVGLNSRLGERVIPSSGVPIVSKVIENPVLGSEIVDEHKPEAEIVVDEQAQKLAPLAGFDNNDPRRGGRRGTGTKSDTSSNP